MKTKDIGELNKIYTDADSADKDLFAEQRSNILLIAGEHYSRRGKGYQSPNQRDPRDLPDMQKLRIVKNHIYRIYRQYTANILGYAPGTQIRPKNESEVQDRKAAELNSAVWHDAKVKYRYKEMVRDWVNDFVGIGEFCLKIFWDPSLGTLVGYEPQMDEEGQPVIDKKTGEPAKTPNFSGGFEFERVFGMNLLRETGVKNMRDHHGAWIIRKMVPRQPLLERYKDDEDKTKFINADKNEEYIVFDSARSNYAKSADQTLIKEFFYEPCELYPEGYFYISTTSGILEQGPLPFGIWPIVWAGYDEFPTSPRGRSPIKTARPIQAEINRASSAQALAQVTLGDDKLIYQHGTKMQPGAMLPGVRGIAVTGALPTVLPGRDGGQYTAYIEQQIADLDRIMMLEEVNQENAQNAEAWQLLFKTLQQKKKFAQPGAKFGQALIDVTEIYLKLAKEYLPDDAIIAAIGKSEAINISEFKNTSPLCTQIEIEEGDETLETMFGSQLTMNHVLQYAGSALGKDDIGKLIRQMPFANNEESFSDLTIDYDNAENDILALERGSMPTVNPYENHDYIVKKLTARMKKNDFEFLPDQIKQNYQELTKQHEEIMAQQQAAIAAAKNEYIPNGGGLVACDLYREDPAHPELSSKRVRVPYQALNWLLDTLEKQGMSTHAMETMNQGSLAEMAQMVLGQQGGGAQQGPPPMPQGQLGPVQ